MLFDFLDRSEIKKLSLNDAEVWYQDCFMPEQDANLLLEHLINHIPFRQDEITIFGKKVMQPRLTCWMADVGLSIKYSGLRMEPTVWDPEVLEIKQKVEQATNTTYNSVLINYYRDGQDSMGWHADNEQELGPDPKIASLSLGQTRKFSLKSNTVKGSSAEVLNLLLGHGSLLFMGAGTQQNYKHQLPKTKLSNGPRINLTFRKMIKSG